MDDEPPLKLWCLIQGGDLFDVEVAPNHQISSLKELIHAKSITSNATDARDLVLSKVNIPRDDTRRDLKVTENEGEILQPHWRRVSYFWPTQPADHLFHIFVKHLDPAPKSTSYADCSLGLDKTWALRTTTVQTIHQILNSERLVQVRGTPGSGKTVLLKLLRNHISKADPGAIIHVISSWLKKPPNTTLTSRLSAGLPGLDSRKMEETYILFDNAQDTYWDTELWEDFFKDHHQRRHGYRIVLFCSYGSPTRRILNYTNHGYPFLLRPQARISLQRVQNTLRGGTGDYEPVGLFLSREEFDELVDRSGIVLLDDDLQNFIFDSTVGHVGAVVSILEALSYLFLEQQRNNVVLTVKDFKAMDKSAFWHEVGDHSAFGRGLPLTTNELYQAGVADVFRDLLINESIVRDSENGDAVDWCHKHGWIHAEAIGDLESVYYVLPSPLHEACLSWRMMMPSESNTRVSDYSTVFDLAVAVLCQFNPARLLNPPLCRGMKGTSGEVPQYQNEFYRGLSKLLGGAFRSPRFGTESRGAHIDFFIDAPKWGIELVSIGTQEDLHDDYGACGTWLPMNDMRQCLILDFRTTQPIVIHDISTLYHVVFESDYTRFKLLDCNLHVVHEVGLVDQ